MTFSFFFSGIYIYIYVLQERERGNAGRRCVRKALTIPEKINDPPMYIPRAATVCMHTYLEPPLPPLRRQLLKTKACTARRSHFGGWCRRRHHEKKVGEDVC